MKCSLKNVRCETSVLFLIERSFNRGAIGYVPSFSLKVVFFSFFSSYGDKVPRTLLGRLFAIAWTLFGLVMISFLLADMTNAFISYSFMLIFFLFHFYSFIYLFHFYSFIFFHAHLIEVQLGMYQVFR